MLGDQAYSQRSIPKGVGGGRGLGFMQAQFFYTKTIYLWTL